LVFKKDSQKSNCKMTMIICRNFSRYLTHFLRYLNILRISWQSLPHLYSRILPEGDPEAQGLRAGWGAIFDWLRTQDLGTQLGIIAGMVAVGYITYRFFFSSDGGAPGAGGPGGDDDEGGANPPDHQNIQPVNIALNNPPAGGLGHEAARYAAAAAVVGGLGHMQDRAMNPDRANAQANPNPNPNQQQQHQPQASVEVVVEAEGQAVAEQPRVDGQPILHEMNPIIPQPDPQGAIINADQAINRRAADVILILNQEEVQRNRDAFREIDVILIQEEVQRNRAAFQEITRRLKLELEFVDKEDFIRYILKMFLNFCNHLMHTRVPGMRRSYVRDLYVISEWISLKIHFSTLGDESLGSPMISALLKNFEYMRNVNHKLSKEESDRIILDVTKVLSIKAISSLLKKVGKRDIMRVFISKRILFRSFSEIFPRISELNKETPKKSPSSKSKAFKKR
jgi:hypothetical protein